MNNKSIAILVSAIALGAASVGCLGAAYLRFEKARKAIGASTIGEELAAMAEKMTAEVQPVECDEDAPERGHRQACDEEGAPANVVQAVFGDDALTDSDPGNSSWQQLYAEAELARSEKAAAKSAGTKNKRKPVNKEKEVKYENE